MINDLDIQSPFLWKFVDDTTAWEVIHKGNVSNAQGMTDEVINPDKCKELRISFSQSSEPFEAATINGNEIEVVNTAKLLRLTITEDLTRNAHVNEVVKKASKKLYFLVQLKCTESLPPSDLQPWSKHLGTLVKIKRENTLR